MKANGTDSVVFDPYQHMRATVTDSSAGCLCISVIVSQATGRLVIGVLHMCVNHDLNRFGDYLRCRHHHGEGGGPGGGGL